jgi:hypothetical protein
MTARKEGKMKVKAGLWAGILAVFVLAVPQAHATASLGCSAADNNLTFSLEGSVNRDSGTIVGVTGGELILKSAKAAKVGTKFKITLKDIVQQWAQEKELRIGISLEPKNGSLFLAIFATQINDDGDFRGRYVLKVSYPDVQLTLKGRLKGCTSG